MELRLATRCMGVMDSSYRRGEPATIIGVGVVQIRAYVERPCLVVRYADGQENAVLFEDVSCGIYALVS